MAYQLTDPEYRAALLELVRTLAGPFAIAGTTGAQLHLADALGADREGPPARAIDVIPLRGTKLPASVGSVAVREVSSRGFDASIAEACVTLVLDGAALPVASPEHVLGTTLAGETLSTEGRWASFALQRALEQRGVDLEEVRGFIKRCDEPDREQLLHELAYLLTHSAPELRGPSSFPAEGLSGDGGGGRSGLRGPCLRPCPSRGA